MNRNKDVTIRRLKVPTVASSFCTSELPVATSAPIKRVTCNRTKPNGFSQPTFRPLDSIFYWGKIHENDLNIDNNDRINCCWFTWGGSSRMWCKSFKRGMMASTVLRMHGVITGSGGVRSKCSCSAGRQSDGLSHQINHD